MATFKVTVFLSSGQNGWSETYYCSASSVNTAFNIAQQLTDRRSYLCGSPTNPFAVRVSDVLNPRISSLTAVGPGTAYPFTSSPGAYTTYSDKVQTAALFTLSSTSVPGIQRPLYVRGNPDGVYAIGSTPSPDLLAWNTNFSTFFQPFITSGSWYIRYRTRPTLASPPIPISNIAPGVNPKNTTVTFNNSPGGAAGGYLNFYSIKGLATPMGTQKIINVDNTGLIYTVGYTLPQGYTYQNDGGALLYVANYAPISFCQLREFTSHKTGRPFGVSRGRARSRHP